MGVFSIHILQMTDTTFLEVKVKLSPMIPINKVGPRGFWMCVHTADTQIASHKSAGALSFPPGCVVFCSSS